MNMTSKSPRAGQIGLGDNRLYFHGTLTTSQPITGGKPITLGPCKLELDPHAVEGCYVEVGNPGTTTRTWGVESEGDLMSGTGRIEVPPGDYDVLTIGYDYVEVIKAGCPPELLAAPRI